jgi:4-hydroxy-tetrahydrodipicolinate reductase
VAAHSVAVFGITGRMGQSLLRALGESPTCRLSGALASAASSKIGQDAGEAQGCGVLITEDPAVALQGASVAVDFSLAGAVARHARACAQARVPLLIGTTGLDPATVAEVAHSAKQIAVLMAPNTSIGVAVLSKLVAIAAASLPGFEVKIAEAHHLNKRDAPSGTALRLGEIIAGVRGRSLADLAHYDEGSAAPLGSIGFSVVRQGEIVGEHSLIFSAPGEELEITHRATDRMIFARGALRAAEWLVGRAAGLYGMQDVLELEKKHGQ